MNERGKLIQKFSILYVLRSIVGRDRPDSDSDADIDEPDNLPDNEILDETIDNGAAFSIYCLSLLYIWLFNTLFSVTRPHRDISSK